MPTGYTSPIYNGDDISFKDFAIRCAKNFGALFHMREEKIDAPIRKRVPDLYYKERLTYAKKELKNKVANPPSIEELKKEYWLMVRKKKQEYQEETNRKSELKGRYEKILYQAKSWIPPTQEHENLKKFMIQQLEDSIDFDCRISELHIPSEQEYIANCLSLSSLEDDIAYYQDRWNKEVKHCEEMNKWIDDLLSSLELKENNEN